MTYAIETLQKELRLVREGLASWGPDYQDIKKRQENKVKELEKAILHLQRSNENPTLF